MRDIIKGLMLLLGLCLMLAGCTRSPAGTEQVNNAQPPTDNKSPAELFNNGPSKKRMGMFSYGIVAPNGDRQVYEYTGKELHIPFKVTGLDKGVTSKFGLLMFVDGLAQPYSIQPKNGEAGEEAVMHRFALQNEETEEFDIVFTPVTGRKGDRLGLVFATILQPDYQPQNVNQTNYGLYHSLSANIFQEINMKNDPPNRTERHPYSDADVEDIPQEIKDQAKNIITDGSSDSLDDNMFIELVPQGKQQNIIYANNGKATLRFRIYGGLEATYHTTIFVNNKPVQINGADYIESTTHKGKMSTVEIELDTSSYGELNTIYAVTVAAGQDYLSATNSPIKTKSMLLVNK